jgi:hypothetical protein
MTTSGVNSVSPAKTVAANPDEKMVDVTDVLFAGDPTKPAIDEILDDGTRDVLVGLELFTVAKLNVRGLAATVLAGETELTPLVVMVKLPEADDTVEVTDVGSVERQYTYAKTIILMLSI